MIFGDEGGCDGCSEVRCDEMRGARWDGMASLERRSVDTTTTHHTPNTKLPRLGDASHPRESQAGQTKPGVRVATIPSASRCCVAFDGNSRQRGSLVVRTLDLLYQGNSCTISPLTPLPAASRPPPSSRRGTPSRIGPPRSWALSSLLPVRRGTCSCF